MYHVSIQVRRFLSGIDAEQRFSQVFSVEGIARPRKHRHVTIAPNGPQETSDESNVTKIELELEEAPEDTILIGSMPAELDVTAEINSTYPNGISGTGAVVVRAEEALIVVLVLVLWVAAIALFFNRWGKIRMLEPYQPKFQQQHRQSCAAMVDQNPLQHRTYSKFNIHCMEHPVHQPGFTPGGYARPRQNSVFVGSSASLLPIGQETPRRAKSAFDLQSLVLAECTVQSVDDECEDEPVTTLKPPPPPSASESSRSLLRDRRTSVCQFDRPDALVRPLQRERGMSICQFDRMDVLARPLQRDRGLSICHFDRTDVLARPLQRDRGSGVLHFDRTDVLARPMHFSKSLSRERRVSVCNFLERDDMGGRPTQRDKRLSMSNVEKIETLGRSASRDHREAGPDKADGFGKCPQKEKVTTVYHFDRPSRSKSPDVVLGYKATCV